MNLLNPCTTPGCPGRAEKGRCATCKARQRRSAPRGRDYRRYDARWVALVRIPFLTLNPRCKLCQRAATEADHYPLSRRALVAMKHPDPDAFEHLRPLCHWCHSRQTAIHQPGGWHRDRSRWES